LVIEVFCGSRLALGIFISGKYEQREEGKIGKSYIGKGFVIFLRDFVFKPLFCILFFGIFWWNDVRIIFKRMLLLFIL
jgi:hypothetical protein